jgi:chromosomal replication initiation ATPase DnaA
MLSPRQDFKFARARWMAMLLMRMHCSMTTTQIARATSRKDHTTVMYGLKRATALYKDDDKFREDVLASEASADGNASVGAHCPTCGQPVPA